MKNFLDEVDHLRKKLLILDGEITRHLTRVERGAGDRREVYHEIRDFNIVVKKLGLTGVEIAPSREETSLLQKEKAP